MRVTAIISRKGGTGKTSTALTMAEWIRRSGQRVLVIDLDSQCNSSDTMHADSTMPGAANVLFDGADIRTCIQHTKCGDILAASPALAQADTILTDTGREYRLREALEPCADDYDHVFIDTSSDLNVLAINALTAADGVVVPVMADRYSLRGVLQIIEVLQPVRKYTNRNVKVDGLLFTRFKGRTTIAQGMRQQADEIAKALDSRVFNTVIRECVKIPQSQALRIDLYSHAPKSIAAKDYSEFMKEWVEVIRR